MTRGWAAFVAAVIAAMLQLAAGMSAAVAAEPDGREVMLVLDTSGSMTAEDLKSARDAALDYVSSVPGDVRVGLITFSTKTRVEVPPTADMAALADALDGLRPVGSTALYDAVALGVSTLRERGSAEDRLVVLSDGGNTAGRATLSRATELLVDNGVVADFVAYHPGSDATAALKRMAKASGGRVLTADDADQLAGVFKAIARSAPVSDGVAESGWLSWWPDWSWQVWALGGVTFTSVLIALLAMLGAGRRQDGKKQVLAQIAQYGQQQEPRAEKPQAHSMAQAAVGWTEDVLRSRGWEEKLAERLDLAGLKMKPAEWTVLQVSVSVVTAALFILVGLPFFVAVPVGIGLGFAGSLLFLTVKIGKRRTAFADQLPDVLQLVSSSLQSGFSFAQALNSVVRENVQPSSEEISRALAETRIGVELEDALNRVADRMDSADLRWVVMAVRIQREVGGNLAEVLLTTVRTMRERAQTRRQVRALSAEGRFSAYLLVALPIVVSTIFFFTRPEYMSPLYTTTIGIMLSVVAVVLVTLGAAWMRQIVKVEV